MAGDGNWIALFSGGKDSSWALHRALEDDLRVARLLTAKPDGDSYLFHVPATQVTSLVAESVSIPHETFSPTRVSAEDVADAGAQGDRELESLARTLESLDAELRGGIDGVVTGAVASAFQRDRIGRLCARYGFDEFSPLWGCDAEATLREMVAAGLDIRIVAVAAGGLDRSWLGRRMEAETVDELQRVRERFGIHLLGEGGEYESLVVDGPHMDRRLRFDATEEWDGMRGRLHIREAWLEPRSEPVTDGS